MPARQAPVQPHARSCGTNRHWLQAPLAPFGSYESSADAIFYEGDPAYRKELKARRRAQDKTFRASLRWLRLQGGLHQTDFSPIAGRTIARIENNQVGKPHGETLSIIARRLDVDPDAIKTY